MCYHLPRPGQEGSQAGAFLVDGRLDLRCRRTPHSPGPGGGGGGSSVGTGCGLRRPFLSWSRKLPLKLLYLTLQTLDLPLALIVLLLCV